MRWILEKYESISVWLSLFILAMAAVALTDDAWRARSTALAFLAGTLLFGFGAAKGWQLDRRPQAFVEIGLTVCTGAAFVLALLHMGGFL
ncbi:MAG: hypothetical protein LUE31_04415 [Lachnospiraceae bacterium]|nr:hypothetical protein [Lachnospiraceae bacterium]